MGLAATWRAWARRLKSDALTLWFAARHPATPWLPKVVCAVAVAYALSPIDLIPDFIPVLGLLDDFLLLPALMWLALKLLPPVVVVDSRAQAEAFLAARQGRPVSRVGAVAIVLVWLVALAAVVAWLA